MGVIVPDVFIVEKQVRPSMRAGARKVQEESGV